MWAKADWKDASTALSISSIILSGVALSLPDAFTKIGLALGVALANAAIYAGKHESAS